MNSGIEALLLIPRLRIQNANAISSPLTHGFPAMSAFLGLMWALNRKLEKAGVPIVLEKVGVVCHSHQEQVNTGFVSTFNLTRNPVDKKGGTVAIVEEGRMHMELSLIFQARGQADSAQPLSLASQEQAQLQDWAKQVDECLATMRVAGGSVLGHQGAKRNPSVILWPSDEREQKEVFRMLRRRCLPGFALVSREDLLQSHWATLKDKVPETSLLDAWLDLSRFNYRSQEMEDRSVKWQHDRTGWIVPIPVGYRALGPLQEPGAVQNARDTSTPFRFVESVYSIGQWLGPHHLNRPDDLLWYAQYQEPAGSYLCCNAYQAPQLEPESSQSVLDDSVFDWTS
jgi:CRISPR-associated protein Csy2